MFRTMRGSIIIFIVICLLSTFQLIKADDCDVASETIASGRLHKPREKLCPGDLIFEDNFDTFDLTRWQHELTLAGGGNWEFQYYTNNRTNSYTENGKLHIRPTYLADDNGEDFLYSGTLDINNGAPADVCTNAAFYGCSRTGTNANILNPIKSARIRTVESFSFKYGTVKIRAKMPSGDWLWPAIWLMPRYNFYGSWPASGEIDLLESRGNRHLTNTEGDNVGSQLALTTLHWGPFVYGDEYMKTQLRKNNASGYDTDFHEYQLDWSSEGFVIYYDGEELGRFTPPQEGFWSVSEYANSTDVNNPWKGSTKMAPFDQEFYLIINLAVGGIVFFDDNDSNPGGKPWSNTSPTAATDFWRSRSQWEPTWNLGTDDSHLIVDYVKIYAI